MEDLSYLIANNKGSKYMSQWLLLRAISLQNLGEGSKAESDYNHAKDLWVKVNKQILISLMSVNFINH